MHADQETAALKERVRELEEENEDLKEFVIGMAENPYPEDIFLPIPTNVLEMIHSTLMEEYKMPLDRLTGHIGRVLRTSIIAAARKLLNK